MEEKLLETLVISFTKTLIDESKKIFDELYDSSYDNIKQFIGKDIKNYLTKQKDKYSHIKTLLRGNTPVYLYDVYFPAKLVENDNKIISTNSSNELFKQYNYITIIGDAGSGKSTLVKHLFLNTIYEKSKIPILIELRYLNETSEELEKHIKNTITQNKLSVNDDILERLLEKGKFSLFLDGYDEVDEKTKKRLVKQINDFVNKYNENYYLLTSRPYSNIESLPLFTNLKMKDLSIENDEIRGFVYKQLGTEKELAEKAVKSIEQGVSVYIHSFLKNPLLLSLYLLTFQNYASIPDKKYIFYRRVINALFSEHDSRTKLGYVREKLCGLDQEVFELVLKSFSFLSYFENEFTFNRDYVNLKLKLIKEKRGLKFDNNKFISDLKSAISLWVDDEGLYSFAHRSLQEYFTALFITELKEEENERVYNKIILKYESKIASPLREVENLLHLLREMDEYNFIKNFYYSLLKNLKEDLNSTSFEKKSKIYVFFFTEGIVEMKMRRQNGENRYSYRPLRRNIISKTIFIHLPFTRKLNEYLVDFLNNEETISTYNDILIESVDIKKENYQLRPSSRHIIFDVEKFDDFYKKLDEEILNELSKEFFHHIDKEIKFCEDYISRTNDTEKDLVDLI